MKKWTNEEIDLIVNHRLKGVAPRDIHSMLPYRTLGAIYTKLNQVRKERNLVYPHGNNTWKDEELLDAVKKYKTTENLNENRKSHEPWASTVCRRFGSWTDALILAGLPANTNVLNPLLETTLYLIHIKDVDIYKVGITQKSIKVRFNNRSDIAVLDFISTDLETARDLEKELLYILRHYKAKDCPDFLYGNGSTECFEGISISKLYDIYDFEC